jgi:hypothetical protein
MSKDFKSKGVAETAGQAILINLNTSGWELEVHENMGWFVTLLNKGLSLRPYDRQGKRVYSCMLNFRGEGVSGDVRLPNCGDYADPNEAVENYVKEATMLLNREQAALTAIKDSLSGSDTDEVTKPDHPLFVHTMGRAYRVTAIGLCEDGANAYLAGHEGEGVVTNFGQYIIIANNNDPGIDMTGR